MRALILLSAAALTATTHDPRSAVPSSGVTFQASDFAFAGPDTITGGVVMVHLVNTGHEAHQLDFYRMAPDADPAAVMRILRENRLRPGNVVKVGGLEAVAPSGVDSVAVVLRPGRYVMMCGLPSSSGRAHVTLGMLRELVVRDPPAAPPSTFPRADVILLMTEYHFLLSTPLRAGVQRLRVENAGEQPHQLIVARLHPGVTRDDVDDWNGNGLAPFDDMGGVAAMDPGQVNVWTVALTPGDYLITCGIRDSGDGRPHFMHGMERVVHVVRVRGSRHAASRPWFSAFRHIIRDTSTAP